MTAETGQPAKVSLGRTAGVNRGDTARTGKRGQYGTA
jgi:hypothetical protein